MSAIGVMGRNIVLCADGTGNTYVGCRSNVARMVELLAMNDDSRQVVAYDQGIGTDSRSWRRLRARTCTEHALRQLWVLPAPHESWCPPVRWHGLYRGLVYGDGLRENVQQMLDWLAGQYQGASDRVYLFGFSRGAFTVRVLAALLLRCGLPAPDATRADFDAAWKLYQPMQPDAASVDAFWRSSARRTCRIRFLGLWDTVKSYGGLTPQLLPHLRHNPIVDTVCHAMALDERRGWFDGTSWGCLDQDQRQGADARPNDCAFSRLDDDTRAKLATQQIHEVWFSGCHGDVGGGNDNEATSDMALDWMLAEAALAGIALSDAGVCRLLAHPRTQRPRPSDSGTWWWHLIDRIPRREIDNAHAWPKTTDARPGPAERKVRGLLREGRLCVHASAITRPHGVALWTVSTRHDEALRFIRARAGPCQPGSALPGRTCPAPAGDAL